MNQINYKRYHIHSINLILSLYTTGLLLNYNFKQFMLNNNVVELDDDIHRYKPKANISSINKK